MTSKRIVLAHGILGFGAVPGWSFVNYFNGVSDHLRAQGHSVVAPQVPPLGSVKTRGDQLAAAIRAMPAGEKVHVIAHSMGGLDARHALQHFPEVRERVATLVTIGCPHRGTPVADAILNGSGPIFSRVPTFVADQLRRADALRDLTTAAGVRFDESTPDVDGVRYIEVAGDTSRAAPGLSPFAFSAAIGELQGTVNDGLVTRGSALSGRPGHEHLEDWPVDHGGEIGWSLESLIPKVPSWHLQHLGRYEAVVALL